MAGAGLAGLMARSPGRISRNPEVDIVLRPDLEERPSQTRPEDPFAGPGEMRALCRSLDWVSTPLGDVADWPAALRTTVRVCMEAPFPMNVTCGPERILIYNDAYRSALGAKHPAALGARFQDVWSEIWDEIAPLFEQIGAGGAPVYVADAPFLVRRADGDGAGRENPGSGGPPNSWFTYSLSAVRDAGGDVVGILNVVSESTDRVLVEREREAARAEAEQAEARLREVFTEAPAFMAVLRGPKHIFEFANDAYYQLVGHRALLGRPVFEALPEARGQGLEELLDGVLETGEPFVGRELPVFLARGPGSEPEQRFLDFVYYPLREADGARSGVVAHGSDVTDHVLARREAQRARADAEEANRAKSDFLASMSHEIRTPINAIIGYTDLLELGIAGPITDAQQEHLERVKTSSAHLLRLIDDILDLAKVEAGRMRVEQERVLALNTIAAALALVGPQAEERGIQIEDSCAGSANTVYMGDQDRVRQILANLLSNAVKFTAPGGSIRITCGMAPGPRAGMDDPESGARAFIRVSDTGIGIAPEQIEAIFRPFTQVERGHTRSQGGTGLGLSISRRLARLMGGDLTAESEPGQGSTFTLWLPSEAAPSHLDEEILTETREAPPPNLAAVGRALQDNIPSVLERYRRRLRDDPDIPIADRLSDADLEDHASTFLVDIAQSLVALERSEVAPARLLHDGSEIQRLVAELHGRQRAHLGWDENALAQEWRILREEIEVGVRTALPHAGDTSAALDLISRFLERAERISHRSLTQTEIASNS